MIATNNIGQQDNWRGVDRGTGDSFTTTTFANVTADGCIAMVDEDWIEIWYREDFLEFISEGVPSLWMHGIIKGRSLKFVKLPCTRYARGRTGKGAG
jgi:hypothetical protein